MSDEKKTIVERLLEAKKKFDVVKFDSKNPHFNSRYASLLSINTAVDNALINEGLLPLWTLTAQSNGAGVGVEFLLTTADGQTLKSGEIIFNYTDPQKAGSALTYGKRYSKAALLGVVAEEDDDGNAASSPKKAPAPAKSSYNPAKMPDDSPAPSTPQRAATPVSEATRAMFGDPGEPLPPPDNAAIDKAERAKAKELADKKKGIRALDDLMLKKGATDADIEKIMVSLNLPVSKLENMTANDLRDVYRSLMKWEPNPKPEDRITLRADIEGSVKDFGIDSDRLLSMLKRVNPEADCILDLTFEQMKALQVIIRTEGSK